MHATSEEILTRLRVLLPELKSQFMVSRIGLYGVRTSAWQHSVGGRLLLLVECSEPLGLQFPALQVWLGEQLGEPLLIRTKAMLIPAQYKEAMASIQYA